MTDIDKLAARPAAYLGETGVPQLTGGLIFFLLGGSVLLQSVLPHNFVAQEAPKWIAIAFCIGALWISRTINQKYVFPRGGYVEMPSSRRRYLSAIAASLAVLVVITIWRVRSFELRFIWPAFAVVTAVIALSEGVQQKMRPMVWLGIYLLCLAPVLWVIPGGNYERGSWLEVAVGAPMAVYGAFRLRSFIRANAPVENVHE